MTGEFSLNQAKRKHIFNTKVQKKMLKKCLDNKNVEPFCFCMPNTLVSELWNVWVLRVICCFNLPLQLSLESHYHFRAVLTLKGGSRRWFLRLKPISYFQINTSSIKSQKDQKAKSMIINPMGFAWIQIQLT